MTRTSGGWFKGPNALVDGGLLHGLTGSQHGLLQVLLRGMDGGATVSRGIRYLAKTVGVTVQTILTARRELRKRGLIEHTGPTPGRHNRTTYQLGEMLKSTRHFQSPKRSSELDILGEKKRSNSEREMVKPTLARDRPTYTR